jgi:eukaryotic-like serine/threonine-protein kinase
MTADRWQQVSQLYHAALERTPSERAGFLRDACAGDDALRGEVESLLAHEGAAAGLIETPAVEVAAKMMISSHEDGRSFVGRRIGTYQILSPLGAGGMGEVYRARDTKLGRDVAIKILPAEFTADAERRARFEREARLLATLNHPNIAQIHGLEDASGMQALVMELVPGETLAEIIAGTRRLALGTRKSSERAPSSAQGPVPDHGRGVPLDQALMMARQICDALDAAHEKGIIHRDLSRRISRSRPRGP